MIINNSEIPQTKINLENWEKILEIKKHVSKELENKREKNIIGSVGISGDSSDNDEIAAGSGIESEGFLADTGWCMF